LTRQGEEKRKEKKRKGKKKQRAHLVPVVIRKLLSRMPPLDTGGIDQDSRFNAFLDKGGNNAFHCLSIG
jgi:hypothetical protein